MKIRAAILGYGRSGSTMHAGALAENDAFEVVAVCDVDPERRKQAEERFGCAVYESHQTMLEREHLDLVCVITRTHQHSPMACDCLHAGVHTLVTKPWALNVVDAERMITASKASGRLLLPWLPARWGCDLTRLKALLDEKAIGDPFLIRRVVSSFGTRSDWQTERRYGGGYLLNWGAHIIDPPVLLVGSRVRSVYGRMKQTINPGDVEDLFMAVMTLDDGTIVQAEFTISAEEIPSWFIQGTQGAIVVRGMHVTIHKSVLSAPDDPTRYTEMKQEKEEVLEETLSGEIYGDEHEIYRHIAAAVCGEAAYPITPDDALELTRVLDAIRTSSEENRVVHL